jgi:hypothetical protein
LARVVDVPFTLDELNDGKKVFERLRENFFQRRGYLRTIFYSAYPEQAKASFLGCFPSYQVQWFVISSYTASSQSVFSVRPQELIGWIPF